MVYHGISEVNKNLPVSRIFELVPKLVILELPHLFPDILRMSGITDCTCLSGKELANSLPDKYKDDLLKKIQAPWRAPYDD
jgi:hypothetical protein